MCQCRGYEGWRGTGVVRDSAHVWVSHFYVVHLLRILILFKYFKMSPSCWLNSFQRNCGERLAFHFIADCIYVMGQTKLFYKTMKPNEKKPQPNYSCRWLTVISLMKRNQLSIWITVQNTLYSLYVNFNQKNTDPIWNMPPSVSAESSLIYHPILHSSCCV